MNTYIAKIKEVKSPSVLSPSLTCEEKTRDELVKFWGLNEPDVEWFRLYRVEDGGIVEI